MNKLLNANFYELLKSKFFYITIGVCALVGAFFTVLMHFYPQVNLPEGADIEFDSSNILSLTPSFGAFIIPYASAATVAMLLETQYNQGTIRNKLISGHTRAAVYFSNLITSIVPSVIYFAAYQLVSMGTAVLAFGYDGYNLKSSLVSLSAMLVMILSISTTFSFFLGNILRGGKMVVVLLATQYAFTMTAMLGIFKKDNEILGFIARIFPQSFMFDFSYSVTPEKIGLNFIISTALMAVFIISGLIHFRKADIK